MASSPVKVYRMLVIDFFTELTQRTATVAGLDLMRASYAEIYR